MIFAPNCNSLGVFPCVVASPAEAFPIVVPGFPGITTLYRLNDSARSSRPTLSQIGVSFTSEKSRLFDDGTRKGIFPICPYDPTGTANAAGLIMQKPFGPRF